MPLVVEEGFCLCLPEELRVVAASRYPGARVYPGLPRGLLRYSELVAVGDRVSRELLAAGLRPMLLVYDCREVRRSTPCPEPPRGEYRLLEARSPPGCISWEAYEAVRGALAAPPAALRIHGEEDLLALVAALYAPQGSLLVYGQPGEGVAVVRLTRAAKRAAELFLEGFARKKCVEALPRQEG